MSNVIYLANHISKNTKIIYPLTPFGMADRLAKRYENKLFKILNSDKFALWNGINYDLISAARLKKIVRRLIEELPNEAGIMEIVQTTEGEFITRDDLKNFKNKKSTPSAINQTIELLQTYENIEKEDSEFDTIIDEIVCQNGILNLKTGVLRKHDPGFLSTRIVNVQYDKNANCPTFLNLINLITCNNPELTRYLQVLIGYFFTGVTHEQQLYIFHGLGSNGKSTLLNILLKIAGLYGNQTPASTLMAKTSGGTASDLPRLKKAWLVNASETNEGQKLDEAGIKILTGGDPVTARLLFKNFETYFAQYKVVLSVNILPEIRGCDHGIFRRIIVVPFDHKFDGDGKVKEMKEQLEQELTGIFAWIVEGAMEYFRPNGGLPKCKAVEKATNRYLKDMDRVENFLLDECVVDRTNHKFRIAKQDLWEMSNEWNRKNCSDPFKKKIFTNMLLRKGFIEGKSGDERQWFGIKFKIKSI